MNQIACEEKVDIGNTNTTVKISGYLKKTWDQLWETIEVHNKLEVGKKEIGGWKSSNRQSRREAIVLTRLMICHTLLTLGVIINYRGLKVFYHNLIINDKLENTTGDNSYFI